MIMISACSSDIDRVAPTQTAILGTGKAPPSTALGQPTETPAPTIDNGVAPTTTVSSTRPPSIDEAYFQFRYINNEGGMISPREMLYPINGRLENILAITNIDYGSPHEKHYVEVAWKGAATVASIVTDIDGELVTLLEAAQKPESAYAILQEGNIQNFRLPVRDFFEAMGDMSGNDLEGIVQLVVEGVDGRTVMFPYVVLSRHSYEAGANVPDEWTVRRLKPIDMKLDRSEKKIRFYNELVQNFTDRPDLWEQITVRYDGNVVFNWREYIENPDILHQLIVSLPTMEDPNDYFSFEIRAPVFLNGQITQETLALLRDPYYVAYETIDFDDSVYYPILGGRHLVEERGVEGAQQILQRAADVVNTIFQHRPYYLRQMAQEGFYMVVVPQYFVFSDLPERPPTGNWGGYSIAERDNPILPQYVTHSGWNHYFTGTRSHMIESGPQTTANELGHDIFDFASWYKDVPPEQNPPLQAGLYHNLIQYHGEFLNLINQGVLPGGPYIDEIDSAGDWFSLVFDSYHTDLSTQGFITRSMMEQIVVDDVTMWEYMNEVFGPPTAQK